MASLYSVIVDLGRLGRREIKVTKELWEDLETVVARYVNTMGASIGAYKIISHRKQDDQDGNQNRR